MFFTDSILEPKRKSRFLVRFQSVFATYLSVTDSNGVEQTAFRYDSSKPWCAFFERSDFAFSVKSVTRPSFQLTPLTEEAEGGISYSATGDGYILTPQLDFKSIAQSWQDIELKLIDVGNGSKNDLEDNVNEIIAALGVHPGRLIPSISQYAPFCKILKIWEYEPIGSQQDFRFLTDLEKGGYGSGKLNYKSLDFAKQTSPFAEGSSNPSPFEIDLFDEVDKTILNRLEGKKALWNVINPFLTSVSFGSSDYSSDDVQEITMKFKPTNCEHYVFDRANLKLI